MKDLKLNLKDRIVFISGANRGIGKAIAIEILKRGAKKVYGGTRKLAALDDLAKSYEGRLIPVQLDVTDDSSIANAVKIATDVDILINNAGIMIGDSLFGKEAITNFKTHFDVNVLGIIKLSQALLPAIKAGEKGAIVSISSLAGLANMPVIGSYSVSKAAAHSVIQGMRAELVNDPISVIGVYPGPIDTDMAKGFEMDKDSPETVAKSVANAIENGLEDVYPDVMSSQIKPVYMANPKAIETEFGMYVAPVEQ